MYLLWFNLLSCSTSDSKIFTIEQSPPNSLGSYDVANTTIELIDVMRERALTIEVWYPSIDHSTSLAESPINFEQTLSSRTELSALYDAAPDNCPTRMTTSIRDGVPLIKNTPMPLIFFSHCLNCGRYSSFSIAERLAGHGMIVVSIDHAGLLPFLPTAMGENLSPSQLEVRVQDLKFAMKLVLTGEIFTTSDILQDVLIDPTRIGVFGHSFGSVTAGFFAKSEPLILAVAGLAAPMENPLFPDFKIKDLNIPNMLLLAEEDNSIGEFGNTLIRTNFETAPTPAWRIDIANSGHWSVSDLCGLTETFSPGCGSAIRHSTTGPGTTFEYLPVSDAIEIAQHYLTAFFLTYIEQRQDAFEYLHTPSQDMRVNIFHRP